MDDDKLLIGRRAQCSYFGTSNKTWRNHGPIYGQHDQKESTCTSGGICNCECDSRTDLPFFQYRGPGSIYDLDNTESKVLDEYRSPGGHEFDRFFCGCAGWD